MHIASLEAQTTLNIYCSLLSLLRFITLRLVLYYCFRRILEKMLESRLESILYY